MMRTSSRSLSAMIQALALELASLILENLRQFVEEVMSTEIVNAVDGIQAKRVHVIFSQPVESVVDDPAADAVALGAIVVDRLAPGRVMGVGETGREFGEIVPFRTEVVVDHVHYDREAVMVAGVDQASSGRWARRMKIAEDTGWRRRIPSFGFRETLRPA